MSAVFALGRALVAPLFIIAGIQKFVNVAGILGSRGTKNFMELTGGGAAPAWLGYLIAFIELAGGLMILFGFKTKAGALLLLVFTVVATLLAHQFWIDPTQQTHALKNLAIMGALLMIMAAEPGPYSLDNRAA
jgi:putative oxidoreductase